MEGAEEKPAGPLTQHQHDIILNNLTNLSLGGDTATKVHVATRQQQRQNEAKLSNDDDNNRKYEIVDGVERFKKWKGRLAVVGTGEIPDMDSSFSSFSPTVAFSEVRMLMTLTVDPRFSVES